MEELTIHNLFNILRNSIIGTKLDVNIDEDMINVLKEQALLPFLYASTKSRQYFKYYCQSFLIHEKMDSIVSILNDCFTKNNIDYIFLKGQDVKRLYPEEYLRTVGDIDVLVREKDYERAKECLLSNNFKLGEESEHHIELKYNDFIVELHSKLFNKNKIQHDYFGNPFEFENNHYLQSDYNFLYIISHYASHFVKGAGIRPIIDIYLMIKKMDLNILFIESELDKLGLHNFYNHIISVGNFIFESDKFVGDEDMVMRIVDFCLESGIHGHGKDNNGDKNKLVASGIGKSKFLYGLSKIFISPSKMFKYYPWTKCIILLPFGYIYRLFFLLFNRKERIKDVLSYKKDKTHYLMDKMGLIVIGDKEY